VAHCLLLPNGMLTTMKSAIDLMLNWDLFENQKFIWLRQIISAVLIGAGGTLFDVSGNHHAAIQGGQFCSVAYRV